METGNHFHNTNSSDSTLASSVVAQNHVVVHLRYDGLSIMISDANRSEVIQLFFTNWLAGKSPDFLIGECKRVFRENELVLEQAASVQWFFSVSKFCLIPDIFYEQGSGETLLDQTARLEPGDHIFSDFWNKRDVVCVYALPVQLVTFAVQQNQNTTIAHSGFALNSLFNQQPVQDNFFFLQVSPAFAELFMAHKGKIIFYNQFPHEGPEDLLYYILFALEQAKIPASEVNLHLAGDVLKGNELYNLLTRYIGQVEEVKLPARLNAGRNLPNQNLRRIAHLIATL